MKAFEQTGWADHPVGEMEVTVKAPAVRHKVPVVRVTHWAAYGRWKSARNGAEMALNRFLDGMTE
jgi:hypothetical protein